MGPWTSGYKLHFRVAPKCSAVLGLYIGRHGSGSGRASGSLVFSTGKDLKYFLSILLIYIHTSL